MTAILWDLDDTLLDTLDGRMKALAHAHEALLGTTIDPLDLWRSHRGGSLESLGRRLVGDRYLQFAEAYRERYFGVVREVRPFAGVTGVLSALHEAHIPMAVVTSKVSWGATQELDAAGLLQYFQVVVGCDDTDAHKPDPEPVHLAVDRMLIDDPAHVLFVGDSPADIWAARNAGVRSVAALWGTIDNALLLEAMPDLTADTPAAVLSILEREASRQ